MVTASKDFYIRVYVGHKSRRFGHEFMEFEVSGLTQRLRYANGSAYRSDARHRPIRRDVHLKPIVLDELKRIIEESKVLELDDSQWPSPDAVGCQEVEIVSGDRHIFFTCSKIGSMLDIQGSDDPEGLSKFYYLVQDLKCFLLSLISLHFKVKPIPM